MKKFTLSLLVTLLCGVQLVLAQDIRVTGKVSDASGNALPGVSVVIPGMSRGVTTSLDGTYAISAPANATLQFSFVGMKTVNAPVNNRSVVNIVLETDTQNIDEVIVVAYGTARRSSFTGSASTVSSSAIKNTRAETIDKALAGKTSGIRVSQIAGDPGAAGEIQVRGIGSITGSTSPLYVVDGVPITTGNATGSRAITSMLTSINTSDIESVTILKDAAAASLYGSRAANGVVIITTKKGTSGKPQVNFSASVGWSKMATNSYEMMSGTEMHDYFVEAVQNAVDDKIPPSGFSGFGNAKDYVEQGWEIANRNGQDWRDYIYGTGMDQTYQASVSGGSENSKYYIGLSYQNMEGQVRGTGMQRYSAIFNTSSNVTKWFTLEGKAQLSYAMTKGNRDSYSSHMDGNGIGSFSPTGLLFQSDPSEDLRNEDGSYNEDVSIGGAFRTPAYELGRKWKFLDNNNGRALLSANAEVRFTDYLKFRSVNGIDFTDVLVSEYWGPKTGDGANGNGMGQKDWYRIITITSSNIMQFSKTFNERHNLDIMGGYEVSRYSSDYTVAQVRDYSTDKLPALSVGIPSNAGGSLTEWLMGSWLMNANYNFDQKYYLGANIRTDKSSRLASENRRGTFWSVSGSWRFSHEAFLADHPVITDAKVRASYGTNGNLPSSAYGYLPLYYFGGYYAGEGSIYPTQPDNPELGWEKSKNMNIGLDFTLFDRFSFTVEYYNKYTTDLLMSVPISFATGFGSVLQNNGDLSNKGFEFEFHGNDVLKTKVKWNTDFILSTLKATVEKLPNKEAVMSGFVGDFYRYEEGKDLYSMFMPTWIGVNPQTGRGEFLIDPDKPATADNITTSQPEAKRSIVAKAYPDLTGSWNNSVSYAGLTLNMLLTYQFGGNLYDYWGYFARSDGRRLVGGWNQAHDVIGNYWQKPGDVVDNPRPTTYSQTSDLVSSRWVKSSDFVRIKEIALTYSLPNQWMEKVGIGGASLSVAVNNLAYVYAATKNIELETPLNGFRTVDTPLPRTVTVGISVNF